MNAVQSSADVEALDRTVLVAGGVVLVPAFTGLGAPYWKPDARGTITGLSRGTTLAHIARAALEAIAFQSAALIQAMARDAAQAGSAAWLAGLASGLVASTNELAGLWQAERTFTPTMQPAEAAERMAHWAHAVRQTTLAEEMHKAAP